MCFRLVHVELDSVPWTTSGFAGTAGTSSPCLRIAPITCHMSSRLYRGSEGHFLYVVSILITIIRHLEHMRPQRSSTPRLRFSLCFYHSTRASIARTPIPEWQTHRSISDDRVTHLNRIQSTIYLSFLSLKIVLRPERVLRPLDRVRRLTLPPFPYRALWRLAAVIIILSATNFVNNDGDDRPRRRQATGIDLDLFR